MPTSKKIVTFKVVSVWPHADSNKKGDLQLEPKVDLFVEVPIPLTYEFVADATGFTLTPDGLALVISKVGTALLKADHEAQGERFEIMKSKPDQSKTRRK